MHKKLPLAAGIAFLSLTFISGYLIGSKKSTHPAEAAQTEASHRAPRLTATSQRSASGAGNSSADSAFNWRSLTAFLKNAPNMTSEQWEKELERIKNDGQLSDILIQKWAQIAPEQALEWIQKKNYYADTIFQVWAKADPTAAAAYFSAHRNGLLLPQNILKTIAREMGRSTPDDAMNWLAGLEKKERKAALSFVLTGIFDNHPEEWTKQLGQLAPEDLKNGNLCNTLASRWSASDWDAANRWIATLPKNRQQQARNAALTTLSKLNPEKAAEEFNKMDTPAQKSAARAIALALSEKSAIDSLEWLSNNTTEEIAAQSIQIDSYSIQEPGLKEYIAGLKDGPIKDAALYDMIMQQGSDNFINYEQTLDQSAGINDREKRNHCISNLLSNWRQEHPAKAKAWIEASNLPAEMKQEHLND